MELSHFLKPPFQIHLVFYKMLVNWMRHRERKVFKWIMWTVLHYNLNITNVQISRLETNKNIEEMQHWPHVSEPSVCIHTRSIHLILFGRGIFSPWFLILVLTCPTTHLQKTADLHCSRHHAWRLWEHQTYFCFQGTQGALGNSAQKLNHFTYFCNNNTVKGQSLIWLPGKIRKHRLVIKSCYYQG